jgi:acyl-CoA thioesterase FadM
VRLIECCREYHWERDVAPLAGKNMLDSISKSLHAEFKRPIMIDSVICIRYDIIEVARKSYRLRFEVIDGEQHQYCNFHLVSVFYDSARKRSCMPPMIVLRQLKNKARNH